MDSFRGMVRKEYNSKKGNIITESDLIEGAILPALRNLGFRDNEINLQYDLSPHKRYSRMVDVAVNILDNIVVLIEVKRSKKITQTHKDQLLRYARSLPKKHVLYGILTNGVDTRIYDLITDKTVKSLPERSEIFQKIALSHILLKLLNNLRSEGYDPITSFEILNRLLLIKFVEEQSKQNRLTLDMYRKYKKDGIDLLSILYKNTKERYPYILDNDEIKLGAYTVEKILADLEDIKLSKVDIGRHFENVTKDIMKEGNSEFYTPREIIDFMVALTNPESKEKILDPACGTGGFLVGVVNKLLSKGNKKKVLIKKEMEENIYGVEIAARISRICQLNLLFHGIAPHNIFCQNALVKLLDLYENHFDLILTNPPFGGTVYDMNLLAKYQLSRVGGRLRSKQSIEVLFLELCLRLLKPGGRVAIVVPDSILINEALGYVRECIKKISVINAVISLPQQTFKWTGTKTSILYLQKKKRDKEYGDYPIFMSVVEHVGYDAVGRKDSNDLKDIIKEYKKFRRNMK